MSSKANTSYVDLAKEYQRSYYLKHRDKKKAYSRKYAKENKEKIKTRYTLNRIKKGLPIRTRRNIGGTVGRKAEYNGRYHLEVRAEELLKIKISALQKVSGCKKPKCCVCGNSDIRVLVINHINGGGREEHRKNAPLAFRKKIISGERAVDDLDVRCQNCNIIYEYERGRCRLPSNWEAVYNSAVD